MLIATGRRLIAFGTRAETLGVKLIEMAEEQMATLRRTKPHWQRIGVVVFCLAPWVYALWYGLVRAF